MPGVSVERLPVDAMGLGLFGFDHLQIVYHGDPLTTRQDDWYVIEGLRDVHGREIRLGIEGWHGGTTLSDANGGRTGRELAAKIGTRESRGARLLAEGGKAIEFWATIVSYATDMEAQAFPYIAAALPGSPLPTLNSSSLVASLLHHAGVEMADALPGGLRLSPGLSTLLGTSGPDTLRAANGFSTLLGGGGDDSLSGSESVRADKLYGGRGNDTLRWSAGSDMLHGGQPGLDYADDGNDAVDYCGAGDVRLDAPPRPDPHYRPELIATHAGGQDLLFSIEEIVWGGNGDRLTIGTGVGISAPVPRLVVGAGPVVDVSVGRKLDPREDALDLSQAELGFVVLVDSDMASPPRGDAPNLAIHGVARIVASPHDDRFVLGLDARDLAIEQASSTDRVLLEWLPSRIDAHRDAYNPRDLIVELYSDVRPAPLFVRVKNHTAGDLGLISRCMVAARADFGGNGWVLATGSEEDCAPDARDTGNGVAGARQDRSAHLPEAG